MPRKSKPRKGRRGCKKKPSARQARRKAEKPRKGRRSNLLMDLCCANYYETVHGASINHLERVFQYLPLLDDTGLIFAQSDLSAFYFHCAKKCQKEQRLLKWFQMCCQNGLFVFNPNDKCKQFYHTFLEGVRNTHMIATLRRLERVNICDFYNENESPFRFLLANNVKKPLLACSQFLQAQWMIMHIQQDADIHEAGYDISAWKHRILFWFGCARQNGCEVAEHSIAQYRKKWFEFPE